ncbi:MAG TPA: histidine kinase [Blastocatellia bacterium]|nr:histidine kinase [Blastocatellia bacterium]
MLVRLSTAMLGGNRKVVVSSAGSAHAKLQSVGNLGFWPEAAGRCGIVMETNVLSPGLEMETEKLLERRWVRVGVTIGLWTLFGLFLGSQMYLAYSRGETQVGWRRIFALELSYAYVWAALTPLVLFLAHRFPVVRERWLRNLLIQIFASVVIGFGTRVFHDLMFINLISDPKRSFSLVKLLLNVYLIFDYGAMIYWLIVLITYVFDYYRRYRGGEIRATRLEAQLALSQLQALKMQLQPHFLFNTLHSISALVYKDAEAADNMIARLGDFLRLTLENEGAQEVSVQQELEFLKCYLDIERIRFRDRLTVRFKIDPQVLDARLPNLILQPIVENAIKHGIAPQTSAGRIEIEASRLNGLLHVQVTDNGSGLQPNGDSGMIIKEGVGLANTQARLQQLYGNDHRLDMINTTQGGFSVILEIPFKQQTLNAKSN